MSESISHILTSSSELWIEKKDGGKRPISGLKNGQILEATVDKAVAPRKARLYIQGKPVLARTSVPLKNGETLLLKVTEASDRPTFQLIEAKDGRFLFLSRHAFEAMGRPGVYGLLSSILKTPVNPTHRTEHPGRLENLARAVSMGSNPMGPSYLKSLIQKSGLSWENKLRTVFMNHRFLPDPLIKTLIEGDLKALAMRLAVAPSETTESITHTIRVVIEGMEQFQLLNSHASQETGKYLLPLPVFLEDTFRFGQILIDLGKRTSAKSDKADRMIRVSVLLEMSNLGNISADLTLLKNAISGSFGVENGETLALIENHLSGFGERLRQNGFTVHPITCRIIDPQILSSASFADQFVHSNDGLLNIVI